VARWFFLEFFFGYRRLSSDPIFVLDFSPSPVVCVSFLFSALKRAIAPVVLFVESRYLLLFSYLFSGPGRFLSFGSRGVIVVAHFSIEVLCLCSFFYPTPG